MKPMAPPMVVKPAAPRKRRWLRVVLVILALIIAVPTLLIVYSNHAARQAWEQAEAQAALDLPRWRLLELQEDRPPIPDEENSGLHMIALHRKALGFNVVGASNYTEIFEKLTPTAELNRQQSELIRGKLSTVPKLLVEARKLKDMPRGRFPIKFSDDFIATLLPDHQNARAIAGWLQHDAMLLAHDEEYDQALESCQAILVASRVFDGDPFLISHLIRIALQAASVNALERVLAQGQASEPALRTIQQALERECKSESGYLAAVRGERAGYHHLFDNIRNGKVSPSWLSGGMGMRTGGASVDGVGMWFADQFPSVLLRYYPELLEQMNRGVDIAKLPMHEREARNKEWESAIRKSRNPVVLQLVPAMSKVTQADLRSQVYLRTALVAVACERYRLKHKEENNENAWAAALEDLVRTKLLDAVPADPLDGQPLRYRRTKDSVAIYSIGFDGKDNGGTINRDRPYEPDVDLGVRLWNVEKRRGPPLPIVPLDAEGGR